MSSRRVSENGPGRTGPTSDRGLGGVLRSHRATAGSHHGTAALRIDLDIQALERARGGGACCCGCLATRDPGVTYAAVGCVLTCGASGPAFYFLRMSFTDYQAARRLFVSHGVGMRSEYTRGGFIAGVLMTSFHRYLPRDACHVSLSYRTKNEEYKSTFP